MSRKQLKWKFIAKPQNYYYCTLCMCVKCQFQKIATLSLHVKWFEGCIAILLRLTDYDLLIVTFKSLQRIATNSLMIMFIIYGHQFTAILHDFLVGISFQFHWNGRKMKNALNTKLSNLFVSHKDCIKLFNSPFLQLYYTFCEITL